jgi:hypothetical protein
LNDDSDAGDSYTRPNRGTGWFLRMRIISTIRRALRSVLHQNQADAFANQALAYEGGNGDSIEGAIIIRGAKSDLMGTWAEFHWLTERFGQKGSEWHLISHSHGQMRGKDIDTMVIQLSAGAQKTIYFDITESFGKGDI